MTEQKKSEKFILDATAGFRMMWFNKHHPNCIYLDQRPECEPDIVGDFRDLKQFPDRTFKLVIFDPPHLLDRWQPTKTKDPRAFATWKFGLLKAETWQSDLKKGLLECWRVLSYYGILLFKWSTHDKAIDEIISGLPFKPLLTQITRSNQASKHTNNKNSQFGANTTLWFCFLKIPKEVGV